MVRARSLGPFLGTPRAPTQCHWSPALRLRGEWVGAEGRGMRPDRPTCELAGCAGEVPRPRAVDLYALMSGGQKAETTVSVCPMAPGEGGPHLLSLWWLLVTTGVFGMWPRHSSLCLHSHVASFPMCAHVCEFMCV